MGIRSNHPVYTLIDSLEALREEMNNLLGCSDSIREPAVDALHLLREADAIATRLRGLVKRVDVAIEEFGE
jgi:hypothetical protein